MTTYNLNLIFCTEAQIFNAAGYTFTSNDTPDTDELYEFGQWAANAISLRTEKAGSRYDPPASGISDVALRGEIVEANAVGAAYRAWRVMAKGGDPHAIQMRDQLREDWIRLIGGTSANGEEITGSIFDAIEISAGGILARSDETAGIASLPTVTSRELSRTFTDEDVD